MRRLTANSALTFHIKIKKAARLILNFAQTLCNENGLVLAGMNLKITVDPGVEEGGRIDSRSLEELDEARVLVLLRKKCYPLGPFARHQGIDYDKIRRMFSKRIIGEVEASQIENATGIPPAKAGMKVVKGRNVWPISLKKKKAA